MPTIAYQAFVREVLGLYEAPLRAKATRDKMRQALAEFGALDQVRRASDLTPPAIAAWVAAHPDRTAVTARSLLRCLRTACRYARMRGYLRFDPFEWRGPADWLGRAGLEDEEEPLDRHLSAEELGRVLARADAEAAGGDWAALRLRALVWTCALTGLRKREALGLRARDIELHRRVIHVRPNLRRPLKTRSSVAPLAIAAPLAAVLRDWLPRAGCPWAFPGARREGPWLSGGPGVRASGRSTRSARWASGPAARG